MSTVLTQILGGCVGMGVALTLIKTRMFDRHFALSLIGGIIVTLVLTTTMIFLVEGATS